MPGLKLPPPPRGKNYLVVLMDAELVDKAGRVEGPYEDDLTTAIENAVGEFIRTRPIQLYLPPKSRSR